MSDAPVVDVDPDEFWTDPYPTLARMRAEAPICQVPALGATLLTRRDDIHTCERNVAVFSSDQPGGLMNELMGKNMMRADGEEHRRERFVYYPAISPNRVRDHWRQRFAEVADAVLADLVAAHGTTTSDGTPAGAVDLVPTYATAVSGECLKLLTGLTTITYQQMDAFSQAMIDGIANYIGDPAVEARCHEATAAIDAAIDERLPDLAAEPDDSLLSVMLASGMPEANVRANIKLTISGGQNEPRDAIAGAVWALLTHPDQLAMVQRGEVSWLQAFEEYCRWISPIGMSPRRIATDHTFGGVGFEPEERVFLMFSSANRDEAHFADADRFDCARDTGLSLAFGAGPHICAGAAASRAMVGEAALPLLFDRLPDLRLDLAAPSATAVDGGHDGVEGAGELADPTRFGGWAFRGPLTMPVRWGS